MNMEPIDEPIQQMPTEQLIEELDLRLRIRDLDQETKTLETQMATIQAQLAMLAFHRMNKVIELQKLEQPPGQHPYMRDIQ